MAEPQSIIVLSLVFLGGAVLAVPLFRFAGLSAVLGYFAAGVAIGPSGFGLFSDANALRSFAELGVVMFLFVIGLELKPSKLLSMRRDILLFGVTQMAFSTALLALPLAMAGFRGVALFAMAFAFALSATAIALQILDERGAMGSPYGQKSFAVLLFQDIAVVPFIALLPVLAAPRNAAGGNMLDHLMEVTLALSAMLGLVFAGRYLLNPLFRLLAKADAREVMTAAALLLVLGSAELMHKVGLSAALGAFIAGLMLAESHFRHQLEADIEPFRGLLLGLFFMSVGMGLDAGVITSNLALILGAAGGLLLLKTVIAFLMLRVGKLGFSDSARAAILLAPVGEFAFVILPLSAQFGLLKPKAATILSAIAALTMFFGPILAKLLEPLLARRKGRQSAETMEENFDGAEGEALVIGFGRYGQVVNQMLLAAHRDVTVIDRNIDQIKVASRFGFKVYYGDGRRLDVLRAAGAERASVIAICVDDREAASAIAEMARRAFPSARLIARAYDRTHALDLMERGIRAPFRETFDSALAFGREALVALGIPDDEADELRDDVRRRDIQRLNRQRDEGLYAGMDLLHGVKLTPEPLSEPRREGRVIIGKPAAGAGDDGVTGASS